MLNSNSISAGYTPFIDTGVMQVRAALNSLPPLPAGTGVLAVAVVC